MLVGGRTAGTTSVPGCPDLSVPLASPKVLDSATTDPTGDLVDGLFVPASFAGARATVVAVQLGECLTSNAVEVQF